MKKIYKYLRHLKVVYGDGYSTEYVTAYTNKERLKDIANLKSKGFLYDRCSHTWVCSYPDVNPVNAQVHYLRYYKIKYI